MLLATELLTLLLGIELLLAILLELLTIIGMLELLGDEIVIALLLCCWIELAVMLEDENRLGLLLISIALELDSAALFELESAALDSTALLEPACDDEGCKASVPPSLPPPPQALSNKVKSNSSPIAKRDRCTPDNPAGC